MANRSSHRALAKRISAAARKVRSQEPNLPPAVEMPPNKIPQELWRRSLYWNYEDYSAYFERWWQSLSADVQKTINIKVESYASYEDWLRERFGGRARMIAGGRLRSVFDGEFLLFRRNLPKVRKQEFLAALQERQKAQEIRDRYIEAARYVSRRFGLEKHRPTQCPDRDRCLSK